MSRRCDREGVRWPRGPWLLFVDAHRCPRFVSLSDPIACRTARRSSVRASHWAVLAHLRVKAVL